MSLVITPSLTRLLRISPDVLVNHRIEKLPNIQIDDPASAYVHHLRPQRLQRVVGRTPRPEPI